ncbi:AAA family ATPase [Leptolyngbya boryana CZ1]|uniref:AAA family ATPase n=1 Tax=Leptolyngbya boryana CZ1 TaxID=3060204 RepID=A0AA96WV46_LEPBY|nr:AAA family ATPase [Leptolyngbya boryana]WNZ46131.1 AAA family ATPase [Leptolyngbya boryana CZ1]
MIQILPYSLIVGQESLKLALELAYIAPRIGGVLISGQRGTGKSTAVRAFAQMMFDRLPVTLPINATEDRVVGGWELSKLMLGKLEPKIGLLEEANKGLLYVDEVNLLDDHIVNIILDVTSTGVLVVQREGQSEEKAVSFTLVGTMNPEEGGLRPQLLDRFGLMVSVEAETKTKNRIAILQTVIDFDEALSEHSEKSPSSYIRAAISKNRKYQAALEDAKENFYNVELTKEVVESCTTLAQEFKAEGNRGDYMIALAARAYAAREKAEVVSKQHVKAVARLALQHRRPEMKQGHQEAWSEVDDERVEKILSGD